ncbi:hypothetical protein MJ546_33820, partial [Burkholderia gladioli]
MITLGIDPGLTGSIATVDAHGALVRVDAIPVMPIPEAGPNTTIKTEVDVRTLWKLLREIVPAGEVALVAMEHASSVGARLGDQAKASLAATKASIMAVVRLQGHDVRRVHPVTWKRFYGIKEPEKGSGLPDGKKQALSHAREFYGMGAFPLAKDHNRAEAALIARWAQRNLT